jgi:hypothetical protein
MSVHCHLALALTRGHLAYLIVLTYERELPERGVQGQVPDTHTTIGWNFILKDSEENNFKGIVTGDSSKYQGAGDFLDTL